jgi:phosphomannomutase
MDINPSIFKAYDIRGIVPDELTPETAYRIGRAFAQYIRITVLNKERDPIIAVNADARTSSPELKKELLRGLLDEKCRVIDCGLGTTPLHYFAINHTKADGGIMVTASHNPSEYNGFKLCRRGAEPIGEGSGMEEIRNTVLRGIFPVPEEKGVVQQKDLRADYIDYICSRVDISGIKNLHTVFDAGNGMVGALLPQVLERLPAITAHVLFGEVDMTFPNHEANPLKDETLLVLQKEVQNKHADVGVAFDGDGDRVRFIASSGFAIPGDIMTAIFSKFILESNTVKHNGNEPAVIIHTVNSSRVVRETIKQAGGRAVESRIGHALIKKRMREQNALFGGEPSGHFYWRDFFFAESALLTTLHLFAMLSARGQTLDEIARPFLTYVSSGEINISIPNTDKALDAVAAHYRDADEIKYIDGISVIYEDFWFNVRPSNTEPLLRISMEAKEKSVLDARLKEVVELVSAT